MCGIDIACADDFSKACVMSCLNANRANTLPLVEVLRACGHERPYREVEDEIDALPIMHMSRQNAHVLVNLLVDAGGLERIAVEGEQEDEADGEGGQGKGALELDAADSKTPEADVAGAEAPGADVVDDFHLLITPAGRSALAEFEPTKRFGELLVAEPEGYADAYRVVLATCERGAKREEVERSLEGHPCLKNPKLVYAGHFISNLETVGGIAWEGGAWRTTQAGARMQALCE